MELPKISQRPLGRTGLQVFALALGTVSLGVDYGIAAPGGFGRPDKKAAERLLRRAADAGINLFDTAPTYGASEELLGRALSDRPECLIATKVSIPTEEAHSMSRGGGVKQLLVSLEQSRRALRRDVLDIVQIHNVTLAELAHGESVEGLLAAQQAGHVRFLGASVYTEEEALAVIACGFFDILQVAYNLLDQRMARRVFAAADEAGVALVLRSALLKGVLTEKAQWLPQELTPLKLAAEEVKEKLAESWQALPELALRFCLSAHGPASVLIGARTESELDHALRAALRGGLPDALLARCERCSLNEEKWLDPTRWSVA